MAAKRVLNVAGVMNSSTLVKIVAAFTAGIVVALGSALIYVRASERHVEASFVQGAPPLPASAPGNDTETLPNADRTSDSPPATVEPNAPVPKKSRSRQELATLGHRFQHNNDPLTPEPAQRVEQQIPDAPPPNPYTTQQPSPVASPGAVADPPVQQPVEQPAPMRQPRTVTLQAGTNLAIRLGETLSTDHNYSGDTFRASLEAPIVKDGAVIAERGSKVLGRVVTVQKAGRVQGPSDISLTLTEINTTDGQRLQVQTDSFDKKGSAATGRDAAKVGGGAALGAIIGAIAGGGKGAGIGAGIGGAAGVGDVLLTRGRPLTLPSETSLTFRLSAPATITERLN